MDAAFVGDKANPGFTFSARCTKRATDGQRDSSSVFVAPAAGSSSGERDLHLGTDLQGTTARRDYLECRATRDERGDVISRVHDLLQIVEHEEDAAVADDRNERIERRAAVCLRDLERRRNGQHDIGGGGDRRKRDERRAARVLGMQTTEQLDCEPCLPGTADTRHSEDPRAAVHALACGDEHGFAAEQRCRRRWGRLVNRWHLSRRARERHAPAVRRAPDRLPPVGDARETVRWILRERALDRLRYVRRDGGAHGAEPGHGVNHVPRHDRNCVRPGERRSAGQHLVKQAADRVKITAPVHRLAA